MSRDDSFEAEALPHMRSLYGTAYRLTRNVHDAEDLVQETFLRAYRSYHRYAPGTNIRAWLYTILHRARADSLRQRSRTPATVELEGEGPGVAGGQEGAAADRDLSRALADLPEPFRACVILRDVEEFSYEEIAAILEAPVGTVMSRIHRGRVLLRDKLKGKTP